MGTAPPAGTSVIDTYLTYLRDVRRVSANTVESYARDLAALAAFAEARKTTVDHFSRRDLEAFVRTQVPGATRVELCHAGRRVVIRRGWEPIAEGCQPADGDTVVALD